jgi:hypothetical protein
MHAFAIIQRLLDQECPSIHAKRRNCIAAVTTAALRGGLGVVRMAKKLASQAGLRHRIKCCDRLLSNPHLAKEQVVVYRAMAKRVLGSRVHVQIAVDWSEVRDDASAQLLRAAAIVKGRAFTIYEEIYPQKKLGSAAAHRRFMQTLRTILPPGCRPIIITDAGFRAPWFKLLTKLDFAWVGRIRNRDTVRAHEESVWAGCKTLYTKARTQARDLGHFLYVRSNPTPCRLVIYKSKPKGRHCKTKAGNLARSRRSKKNSTAQREPWLLAVSPTLDRLPADQVVSIYSGRMQIEQTFRDLKNAQWGAGLSNSQTRGLQRLAVLLLIGALLTYALWLIGLAARSSGFNIAYGSKAKSGTTLSILSLATHWLDERQRPRITRCQLNDALIELISMVRTYEI